MSILTTLVVAVLALAAGVALGFLVGKNGVEARLRRGGAAAEDERARILAAAEQDAENLRKAEILAGKEEAFRAKEEWEREEARRRDEIERTERRLDERQESLDRKFNQLDEKAQAQEKRAEAIGQREQAAEARELDIKRKIGEVQQRLESLAGM